MAFLKSSRYFGLPTATAQNAAAAAVVAVKLRRLPPETGDPRTLVEHDRLDILAQQIYRDGTWFWHIADANTELIANALVVPGRTIIVPPS